MNITYISYIIEAAFLAFGILFLKIASMVKSNLENKKQKCKCITTGLIINVVKERINANQPTGYNTCSYFPVYEYVANNKKYTIKSNIGGDKNTYSVGDRTELYYNKNNPKEIYIPSANEDKISTIFKWIGILFCVIAVITFLICKIIIK